MMDLPELTPITASAISVLLGILMLNVYLSHKIRRVHLQTFEIIQNAKTNSDNLILQMQHLLTLDDRLSITYALPPLRGWQSSPDFLVILMNHALKTRPHVTVECGSGASTIILARCSQICGDGHVYSLEHDIAFAKKTRDRLSMAGLTNWATVVHAPLIDYLIGGRIWQWYSLGDLPDLSIDLLVVDGPPMPLGKMIRYPAGPLLLPKLSEAGTVFLDDTHRPGEKAIIELWTAEHSNFISEEFQTEKGCVALSTAPSSTDE
jgi:hypothetical protein